MKKILRIVETFISVLLITLASLLSFSIAWMFKTWTNLSMEELVFHLEVPLEGTNEDMIIEYIRSCAVPTVIIFLAAMVMIAAYRKKKVNLYFPRINGNNVFGSGEWRCV